MCGWACVSTLGAKKNFPQGFSNKCTLSLPLSPTLSLPQQLGSAGCRLATQPSPHPKFISYDTYTHTVTLHCAFWRLLYSLPSRNHKSMSAYVTVSVKDSSIRKPLTEPFHQSGG